MPPVLLRDTIIITRLRRQYNSGFDKYRHFLKKRMFALCRIRIGRIVTVKADIMCDKKHLIIIFGCDTLYRSVKGSEVWTGAMPFLTETQNAFRRVVCDERCDHQERNKNMHVKHIVTEYVHVF